MVVMTSLVRVSVAGAMAAALAGVAIGLVAREPAPSLNVAIRVDCTSEALCAFAESRALDVWSEHAGPGLPMDLVVDSDTLDQLHDLVHHPCESSILDHRIARERVLEAW